MFSLGVSGFSAFKTVIWIKVVTFDNLSAATALESLLSGLVSVFIPLAAGFLSVTFQSPKLLFQFNSLLMLGWYVIVYDLNTNNNNNNTSFIGFLMKKIYTDHAQQIIFSVACSLYVIRLCRKST